MASQFTDDEKRFIEYWEQNRAKEKKILNQLLIGLPLGILFAAPVLLNLFFGWYKRAEMQANSRLNPIVLITALMLIIVFVAIFSRRHKWDLKDQHYRELIARKETGSS